MQRLWLVDDGLMLIKKKERGRYLDCAFLTHSWCLWKHVSEAGKKPESLQSSLGPRAPHFPQGSAVWKHTFVLQSRSLCWGGLSLFFLAGFRQTCTKLRRKQAPCVKHMTNSFIWHYWGKSRKLTSMRQRLERGKCFKKVGQSSYRVRMMWRQSKQTVHSFGCLVRPCFYPSFVKLG